MNALNIDRAAPTFNVIRKGREGWEAKTYWNLPENHRIKFVTWKDSRGNLTTTCSVCTYEDERGYSCEKFTMGVAAEGDMFVTLASNKVRVTEAALGRQHVTMIDLYFNEMVAKCFNKYKTAMKLEGADVPVSGSTPTAQLAQSVIDSALAPAPAPTPTADPAKPRTIRQIAYEIKRLWTKPYFGAVPYLNAMCTVDGPNDTHGCEDGKTQVLYFLSNASTWRGEDAKRIKAELKKLCNIK